jgi:hypothetical protein
VEEGRICAGQTDGSLLYVVGLGIYSSSFAKDLVCTPRPYSPPVTRLSEFYFGRADSSYEHTSSRVWYVPQFRS